MEFLREKQLNIMLMLIGVCALLTFLALFTRFLRKQRKIILVAIELSSMILLVFDRYAYIYRGDMTQAGYIMVRVSNFMVFAMELLVILLFDFYLIDLFRNEGGLPQTPVRLKAAALLGVLGLILIVVSQFTGLYYTFDEYNNYRRTDGYLICYIVPFLMLLLQTWVVCQYYRRLTVFVRISILLFAVVPISATVCQVFLYGLSLTNISIVGVAVILYYFALLDLNERVTKANRMEIEYLKEQERYIHSLFEETAEALATAIDAKDTYTRGHSARVAEYSRRLAEATGLDEKECEEVYFAALLHDVGKIGVPDLIIQKTGRLTPDEFGAIKEHPVIGKQILSSIGKSPYLRLAANYHHERYDGKGYPEGLKGEDIPKFARIISVADAYDAMTSKRSYRDPLSQEKVREEMVKGVGTQFDPVYAGMMIHFIDLDKDYEMREKKENFDHGNSRIIDCVEYLSDYSEGIILTPAFVTVKFRYEPKDGEQEAYPAVLVFDSTDGRIQTIEAPRRDMQYSEYAMIIPGERFVPGDIRKHTVRETYGYDDASVIPDSGEYVISALKIKDHIMLRIYGDNKTSEIVMAAPDNSRYAYIAVSGRNCLISDIEAVRDLNPAAPDTIPRIAPEISFIDVPDGDMPNLQIDGWRTASGEGIRLKEFMQISFHTFSLPTARLIWHCPFISIFSSDDGRIDGPDFREYALIRLDGESWSEDPDAHNRIITNMSEDFGNWDDWKRKNREGLDVDIRIKYSGNTITVSSENAGVGFRNVTTLPENVPVIYAALTGDQCAITGIKVR